MSSIPRQSTSASVTREPKATVARIAIFAAASAPETSSVGSASAKPRCCASASASSNVAPPSISVRMKFVVPLTIPSTRWTFVTTSDSRSTLITGIAAQTLASKRSWTPASAAAAKSSAPRWATSCLFAVTTGFPAASSSSTWLACGLDAAHHLGDDADCGVVADRRGVRRQDARVGQEVALLLDVAYERADDPQPVPGCALDVLRVLDEKPVDRGADRSVAEEADSDDVAEASQPSTSDPSRRIRARSSRPTCSSVCSRRLRAQLGEAGLARVHLRDPLLRERARADVLEQLAHPLPDVLVDHARAAGEVAELGRVGDGVAHAGEATLPDQVDDELELVQALVVRDLGLVAGVDERLEARADELGDAAAEHGLLAEEVGLGLLGEARLDHAGAGGADPGPVREREVERAAARVLGDGDDRRRAEALLEEAAHDVAGALRRDHDHVVPRGRRDPPVVDVEAVREEERGAGGEVRRHVLLVHARLHLIRQEQRDDLRVARRPRRRCRPRRPASSAAAREELPSRRPTSTSTPESCRFSACAWPWLP